MNKFDIPILEFQVAQSMVWVISSPEMWEVWFSGHRPDIKCETPEVFPVGVYTYLDGDEWVNVGFITIENQKELQKAFKPKK